LPYAGRSVRAESVLVPSRANTSTLHGFKGESGEVYFPWQDLLLYVLLRFLQGASGSMGVINNVRAYLWIPVEQYTRQEISVSTFAHMHQYVAPPDTHAHTCGAAR
jgi:ABC-type transport system involved in Fe-S cluster assembly fused permease/ATPase subunit